MQEVIIWFPERRLARAVPKIARLLDSVPPEVKMISFSFTRSDFAISALASRTYCSASTPFVWREEVLP